MVLEVQYGRMIFTNSLSHSWRSSTPVSYSWCLFCWPMGLQWWVYHGSQDQSTSSFVKMTVELIEVNCRYHGDKVIFWTFYAYYILYSFTNIGTVLNNSQSLWQNIWDKQSKIRKIYFGSNLRDFFLWCGCLVPLLWAFCSTVLRGGSPWRKVFINFMVVRKEREGRRHQCPNISSKNMAQGPNFLPLNPTA